MTLPNSPQKLTFDEFNQSLARVTLPNSLQNLTFGDKFNQNLERKSLPNSLQNMTFGHDVNQSLEHVTFPTHKTFNWYILYIYLFANIVNLYKMKIKIGILTFQKQIRFSLSDL